MYTHSVVNLPLSLLRMTSAISFVTSVLYDVPESFCFSTPFITSFTIPTGNLLARHGTNHCKNPGLQHVSTRLQKRTSACTMAEPHRCGQAAFARPCLSRVAQHRATRAPAVCLTRFANGLAQHHYDAALRNLGLGFSE